MGIIHRLSISIGDLDSRDVNLSRVFEAINEIIGKPMWKGYVWRHIPCILNVVHVTKWRIFEVLCDACSKVHDVIVKWCLKTSNILYFSSKNYNSQISHRWCILHIALNIFFRWRICAKLNLNFDWAAGGAIRGRSLTTTLNYNYTFVSITTTLFPEFFECWLATTPTEIMLNNNYTYKLHTSAL